MKGTSKMSTEARKEPSRVSLVNELSRSIEERIAWFHQMQETQPVRYRPEYNLWEVFRYKDVIHKRSAGLETTREQLQAKLEAKHKQQQRCTLPKARDYKDFQSELEILIQQWGRRIFRTKETL